MEEIRADKSYRIVPAQQFDLLGMYKMILSTHGTMERLPNSIAEFLSHCRQFSSFESHSKSYLEEIPASKTLKLLGSAISFLRSGNRRIPVSRGMSADLLSEVLDYLAKKGLMIKCEDFLNGEMKGPGSSSKEALVTSIGTTTKDSPEILIPSLESYVNNVLQSGRKARFVVMDDSLGSGTENALKEMRGKFDVPLFYGGRKQKEQFVTRLEKKGIPKRILEFGLFGNDDGLPTYGGNRNAFLLDTAGELSFCCDHDTRCRISKPPTTNPQIKIASASQEVQKFWHFESREDALTESPEQKRDLLSLHEEVLGKNVRDILRKSQAPPDVRDATSRFIDAIGKDRAKVLISLNGLLGDSAMRNPLSFVFSDTKKERENLREADFNLRFTSREKMKSVDQLVLQPANTMMTTFFGLDNREMLPPSLPVLGEADSLFGELIGASIKEGVFAYLPWALLHAPPVQRSFDFEETPEIFPLSPVDFIKDAISEYRNLDLNRKELIRFYGARLVEKGKLPPQEFLNLMKRIRLGRILGYIYAYNELLGEKGPKPEFWKKAIQKRIDGFEKLVREEPPLFSPLIESISGPGGETKYFQKLVLQFGELLDWWPAIAEAVREIKNEGNYLAEPIRAA